MHLTYSLARQRMQTGDVIAFADDSFVSRTIRWASGWDVSHVAIVYRTSYIVELLETVKCSDGKGRVAVTQLSKRLEDYAEDNGRVWWCPTHRPAGIDAEAMVREMLRQEGTPYDFWQAVLTRLWPWPRESSKRLFCSESVAFALRAGRILPASLNPSRAKPGDVTSWRIYNDDLYQLVGEPENIRAYNTVDVRLWRAVK